MDSSTDSSSTDSGSTEPYYYILVENSQGELEYVYLGTTSTQLYHPPPVPVSDDPSLNKSAIFILHSTGEKENDDTLWTISNYVTPNISAKVRRVNQAPQTYDIFWNGPVDQRYKKFYFRDASNQPVHDPVEGDFLSICFNGRNGTQIFLVPGTSSDSNRDNGDSNSGSGDSNSDSSDSNSDNGDSNSDNGPQPITGGQPTRGPGDMAKFQLMKIPRRDLLPVPTIPLHPAVVCQDKQTQVEFEAEQLDEAPPPREAERTAGRRPTTCVVS